VTGLGGVQSKDCLPCLRGWHTQCRKPCPCEHKLGETNATIITHTISSEQPGSTQDADESDSPRVSRTRRAKRDDALKDQQSTGRKRAAQAYPFLDKDGNKLKRGADISLFRDCEWAGKTNVGGGIGITGCGLNGEPVGKGINRHHGPDKNTLNNEVGNVHRICPTCHNRWHAKNDADYDPNKPLKD
jgi:hypothetical protein